MTSASRTFLSRWQADCRVICLSLTHLSSWRLKQTFSGNQQECPNRLPNSVRIPALDVMILSLHLNLKGFTPPWLDSFLLAGTLPTPRCSRPGCSLVINIDHRKDVFVNKRACPS